MQATREASQASRPSIGTVLRRVGSAAAPVLLPTIGLAIVIAAWWAATAFLGILPIVLPPPLDVWDALITYTGFLVQETRVTLYQVLIGYALTVVGGLAIGTLIANSKIVDQMVSPWLVALNAIPKVALAPLLVVWMGFGREPRIVMVILLCFFPIVLATVAGLTATPTELVELARSLEATRWQVFIKIRYPNALPHIFVGLKVAMPLAVVGSVIGEFRGRGGLGQIIVQAPSSGSTDLAFASIVVLSVISIALYYAVVGVERLLLPWVPATVS